jgi:HEAT repeat protein
MARRSSFDQRLEAVRAIRDDPDTPEGRALLAQALADRSALVVTAAAETIAAATLDGFGPALTSAFDRLLAGGDSADPGCRGKTAIVRALVQTDHDDGAVYLRGVRHVQYEPVWGGREEVAAVLRGQAALGLVRARHPDATAELAALLADAEAPARVAAAQVLGEIDPTVAVPLLRFKVLAGDKEAAVIGACLTTLLASAPGSSVPFVAQRLQADSAVLAEAAAMALGESRLEAAFEPLAAFATEALGERRAVALLALALLRSERAWAHLLEVVATGAVGPAKEAATALATFRHDAKLAERLRAAAARHDHPSVRAAAEAAMAGRPRWWATGELLPDAARLSGALVRRAARRTADGATLAGGSPEAVLDLRAGRLGRGQAGGAWTSAARGNVRGQPASHHLAAASGVRRTGPALAPALEGTGGREQANARSELVARCGHTGAAARVTDLPLPRATGLRPALGLGEGLARARSARAGCVPLATRPGCAAGAAGLPRAEGRVGVAESEIQAAARHLVTGGAATEL